MGAAGRALREGLPKRKGLSPIHHERRRRRDSAWNHAAFSTYRGKNKIPKNRSRLDNARRQENEQLLFRNRLRFVLEEPP